MEKIFRTISIIMLAISALLVVWGIAATPSDPATPADAPVIGYNLVWGYILLGVAVVVAIASAIMGLATNPKGIKSAIISIVAIAVVVIVSVLVASGHDIHIPDVQNNSEFGHSETVLTDASILITYVAMAGAIITAIYSAISDSLK